MRHFFAKLVPQPIKNIFWHLPQAVLANVVYGFPAKRLKVIGITGTNGKTTTTTLVGNLLEAAGKKVAVASTIATRLNGVETVNVTKFTTASPWTVQKFLKRAVEAGCEYVVLEVSSHALDQYRVWGIAFEGAVVTNVTREHLDYHKTLENYRGTKAKLFRMAKWGVINLDMERPETFLTHATNPFTYSTKQEEASVMAKDINLDFKGASFAALGQRFETHLAGLFNVENVLAMLAVGKALELSVEAMQQALQKTKGVPGRMELVPNTRGVDIVIDYAVTPDAFEKLYNTVLPLKIPGTKIIHVFGACGERDRGKRPIMGKIASEKADIVILTNEDPYYEDAEKIIDDVEAGIERKKEGENFYRIFDRREAIHQAFALAETGDIVLVTGKGAEETMAIGAKRVPWKERQVIEEELAKRA